MKTQAMAKSGKTLKLPSEEQGYLQAVLAAYD